MATGLAAGHWPIKSTQGQRAIGVSIGRQKEVKDGAGPRVRGVTAKRAGEKGKINGNRVAERKVM